MRVGAYVPVISDQPAGLENYCHELLSRLAPRLDDLRIWSQRGSASWQGASQHGVARTLSGSGIEARAMRLAWLSRGIARRASTANIDVAFFPAQEGPLVRLDVPVCIVVHDLIPLKQPRNRRIDALQIRTTLSRMLRLADRVIAVSENTKADVVSCLPGIPPDKIVVIHEGIDHSVFFPRLDDADLPESRIDSDPYILYSGTLAPHKNAKLLLQVLADCARLGTPMRLLVSGRSRDRDVAEFMQRAEQLRIAHRVEFLGYVPVPTLTRLMTHALAFVFPSRYEGFGLAPLEAMACGAPVISSNAGSLPEVVGDGGTLLDPDDRDAWLSHVMDLATDHERRIAESERALQHASRFTWNRTVDATLGVLKSLV